MGMDWFTKAMVGAVIALTLVGACDGGDGAPKRAPDRPVPTVLIVDQNPNGGGFSEEIKLGGGPARPLVYD